MEESSASEFRKHQACTALFNSLCNAISHRAIAFLHITVLDDCVPDSIISASSTWSVASRLAVVDIRDADLSVVPCPCLCSRMALDGKLYVLIKLFVVSTMPVAVVRIGIPIPFAQQGSVETRGRRTRWGRIQPRDEQGCRGKAVDNTSGGARERKGIGL